MLTRLKLLPEQAPPRHKRRRHWLYSLTRAHDSLGIAELDVPWWTYAAIDDVDRWLAGRDGVHVFEWGSGASTLWLGKRAAVVRSVEHHRGFGESIQAALRERRAGADVRLDIVEPVTNDNPTVPSAKEGHGALDFAAYVRQIDAVAAESERDGREFDLIVIDGRAREACLTAALAHLADDGLIVFDNTRRVRYRRAIEAAPVVEVRHRGLTPTLPYPDQTSLLTRR